MTTFDTRRAVQRLTEAGVDNGQADAIVEVLSDATSPLVTQEFLRAEFAEFRAELQAESAEFRAEMRAEFAEFRGEIREGLQAMRAEMYQLQLRLAGFAIAVAAVAVAIAKLT